MIAGGHRSHDGRKGDELLLLGAQERIGWSKKGMT